MEGRLKSIIRQLEKGVELCGFCGKDITDEPSCVHSKEYVFLLLSETEFRPSRRAGGPLVTIRKTVLLESVRRSRSMRIGMECLMDLPYLESLPLCDPPGLRRRVRRSNV